MVFQYYVIKKGFFCSAGDAFVLLEFSVNAFNDSLALCWVPLLLWSMQSCCKRNARSTYVQ